MTGQVPDFATFLTLKRQAEEFPAGGAVMANPTLLPPGARLWEDGSWSPPPPPPPGTVAMLPGLFGHRPGAFVPYPEG